MRKHTSLLVIVFVAFLCAGLSAQYPGWTIPAGAKDEKSPLKASPALLSQGKVIFAANCQKCHGATGVGNGPSADPEHPPADLTDPFRASLNTDGVLYYKIWNGHLAQPSFSPTDDMPPFSSKLTKDQVWTLIVYVDSLRKPG
jgi:mono/diheme cytochrome c family protein